MNTNVDLGQLRVRREEPSAALGKRRSVVSRYVLPAALLAGFAAIVAWAAREQFLPAREVTVVPVLATRADVRQAGAPLFQAAGWVEPRPTPIKVTALAEGVVARLLVVEGQAVAAGEPIAELVDADARLSLADAEAMRDLQQAEVESARARQAAAETNLAYPLQLQAMLAEAEAELAKMETEQAHLPIEHEAAEARLEYAQALRDGRARAGDAVTPRALQEAEADLAAAEAQVHLLHERMPRLDREVEALTARRDALAQQLELKTDLKRELAEAQAAVRAAAARARQAAVVVDQARLRLERMIVTAPVAGRVLQLVAQPGTRLMGENPDVMQEAATVVTMYDPQSLQVRADVRLDDVPHVQPGQKVQIGSAALADPITGTVLFETTFADIQKNTLQVKVALSDPPPVLKPEMLVDCTFLAPERAAAQPGEHPALSIYVPGQLVERGDAGAAVWVADQAAGVARRKTVKPGRQAAGGLVEIVEGLQPGDRLIVAGREGLQDGDRIRVTGEDATLGAGTAADSHMAE
jgi:RND family efflux transporter MFP subunit